MRKPGALDVELTAASRREHLVLYDPQAIPADTPVDPDMEAEDPRLLPAEAMMQLASRGQAFVVHIPEEDCEARFRLFVDEAPAEEIRRKGQVLVTDARLRVPSGVVRADGLEFLCRPGESRTQSEPDEAAVPSGVYSLEVLSLWGWKAAHRIAEGRRGIGRAHRVLHTLVFTYTWLGIVMIPVNLFVAPMVVAWFWRRAGGAGTVRAVAVILAIDAVILAGFWLLDALKRRYARLFLVARADADFEAAHPDFVVVLRTSDDDGSAAPAYARALAST